MKPSTICNTEDKMQLASLPVALVVGCMDVFLPKRY